MPGPWMTQNELLQNVKETDIVEIDLGSISHFVMYIKNAWVVHVTTDSKLWATAIAHGGMEGIKETIQLQDVTEDHQCRINNFESKRLKLRTKEECIEKAREGIENGRCAIEYNSVHKNCEHYCIQWKYQTEKGDSRQGKAAAIGGSTGLIVASELTGLGIIAKAVGVGTFFGPIGTMVGLVGGTVAGAIIGVSVQNAMK